MRKKTIKKNAGYEKFCKDKEEWDSLDPKERHRRASEMVKASAIARKRHARYEEDPIRSVRGISKVRRNCHYKGWGNGMLCVACMRRGHMSKKGTCSLCGSASTCYIGPRARLPGRKSTKQHWKRFLKKHVGEFMYMGKIHPYEDWPDDFMANL